MEQNVPSDDRHDRVRTVSDLPPLRPNKVRGRVLLKPEAVIAQGGTKLKEKRFFSARSADERI
jgi:hypothetical protein